MTTPRHLVAVWNPSYAADAMDEHLRILVDWNERFRRGEAKAEDVFVWWARLRSGNRMQPLPHTDDVLALGDQIEHDVETHLYLTDYRSLYVALLADVTSDDPLEMDDADHMPLYEHNKPADFYFMLDDIRRLVADDTVATVQELAKLQNVRYDGRPVSLYGGMTDLPLIVERKDARLWFSDDGGLTDGRLWAEHDIMLRGETDRVSRELRENLLGDVVWGVLEHGTRAFLATGEATFRARRHDPAYDFSTVTIEYAKAIETEMNAVIFPALRRVYSKGNQARRYVNVDGRQLDLGAPVSHQTLGTIINLLAHSDDVAHGIKAVVPASDANYLLGEVMHQLAPVADLRNPAAHSSRTSRADASALRDRVLGIGQEGMISRLARVKLRAAP